MTLKKGARVDRGYATVAEDDGVKYREIAEVMTGLGFTMNHSSARNYVLRVMRKLVAAVGEAWGQELDERRIDEIAKDPGFQHAMSELLHVIEARRRARCRR